jgi:hypothetical protein
MEELPDGVFIAETGRLGNWLITCTGIACVRPDQERIDFEITPPSLFASLGAKNNPVPYHRQNRISPPSPH